MTPEIPALPGPDTRRRFRVFQASVALLLSLAILAIYFRTRGYAWLSYDDDTYVYANRWVTRGLSAHGLLWAFQSLDTNWHPLTWISLMLDVQLFGLRPGPQHLINAGLHMASTVLLLMALTRLTGKPVRSALTAAIFAVHPLHVESVAWVAERKDVLCAFFEMLTLLFYSKYAEERSRWRQAATTLAFACALMAKPMAVTFPFVLLLLDYWPLGRLSCPPRRADVRRLVVEKVPLFGLSLIASILTFIAQRRGGAVMSFEKLGLAARLAHAPIAWLWYARKSFWPANLAFFYPLQAQPMRDVVSSLLILAAVTAAAFHWRKRRPYLIVGWLWYLGMLIPVIGIVQTGPQATADRYSYLPITGLSIAIIWLIAEGLADRFVLQAAATLTALVALLTLAIVAYRQAATWKNSETLFERAIAVTNGNYLAENDLGAFLAMTNRHVEAMGHFEKAVAVRQNYPGAQSNLGGELLRAGRLDEAFSHFEAAHRLDPKLVFPMTGLGTVYTFRGEFAKAREQLTEASRRVPDDAGLQEELCFVMAKTGDPAGGAAHCREALRLQPGSAGALLNLGRALAGQGDKAAAMQQYEELLARYPSYPEARAELDALRRK